MASSILEFANLHWVVFGLIAVVSLLSEIYVFLMLEKKLDISSRKLMKAYLEAEWGAFKLQVIAYLFIILVFIICKHL